MWTPRKLAWLFKTVFTRGVWYCIFGGFSVQTVACLYDPVYIMHITHITPTYHTCHTYISHISHLYRAGQNHMCTLWMTVHLYVFCWSVCVCMCICIPTTHHACMYGSGQLYKPLVKHHQEATDTALPGGARHHHGPDQIPSKPFPGHTVLPLTSIQIGFTRTEWMQGVHGRMYVQFLPCVCV